MAEGAGGSHANPLKDVAKGFKGLVKAASQLAEGTSAQPHNDEMTSNSSEPSTTESASTSTSRASWMKLSKKKLSWENLPLHSPGGSTESLDVEQGEASSDTAANPSASWQSLAKSTAKTFKKQASKKLEQAQKNIDKAAEKVQNAEIWSEANAAAEKAKKNLSGAAKSATHAGSALAGSATEKAKAAQSAARELQAKGQENLGHAKEAAAAKAKQAKEKAGNVAGAAKNKLAKAGSGLGGLAALTMSPALLAKFGGLFFLGTLLITLSFSFLPMLPVAPQKFALLFAFGSMTMLSSFAVLKGPKSFFEGLMERSKLPFSLAYVIGLVGTVVATIVMKSYLLTAVFGVMQAVGLLYFVASHVPGGKACLNFIGRGCGKAFGKLTGACRTTG